VACPQSGRVLDQYVLRFCVFAFFGVTSKNATRAEISYSDIDTHQPVQILSGALNLFSHVYPEIRQPMTRHLRFGVLVPSSNTALEPLTQAMISSISDTDTTISVHFSRFAVTQIDLSAHGLAQFELEPILAAARLLVHANVDVIGWSGTSAGWLGFDYDDRLCDAIRDATGVPATTSTMGLNRALELWQVKELALVTPYLAAVNDAIITNYEGIGVRIDRSQERHLDITDNHAIGDVSDAQLDSMVEEVVKGGAKFVTTFCTNIRTAQRVEHWERKYGIVVFDTVATVVWDMLRIAGETQVVKGWGSLFTGP
jgi:maleate isomerase